MGNTSSAGDGGGGVRAYFLEPPPSKRDPVTEPPEPGHTGTRFVLARVPFILKPASGRIPVLIDTATAF